MGDKQFALEIEVNNNFPVWLENHDFDIIEFSHMPSSEILSQSSSTPVYSYNAREKEMNM